MCLDANTAAEGWMRQQIVGGHAGRGWRLGTWPAGM
jgi:hypothetical protein